MWEEGKVTKPARLHQDGVMRVSWVAGLAAGQMGMVAISYLEVMDRPRAAPTAADTGVDDLVGAALRLWAM